MKNKLLIFALGTMCLTWPLSTNGAEAATTETITSQTAVVIGSQVNLRSGPGTEHSLLGQVNSGDSLPVLGRTGDWYQVKKSDGNSAWIAGWLVRVESTVAFLPIPQSPSPVEQPTTPDNPPTTDISATKQVAVVTATDVNLRGGPGTNYPVVGQATIGDKLPLLDRQGDWLKVQANGQAVWIANWLVRVENERTNSHGSSRGEERPATNNNNNWLPIDADKEDQDEQGKEPIKKEAGPNDPQLTDITVTEKGDTTVIRVEANTPLEYNTFMLSNPRRLVINLEGLYLGKVSKTTRVNSETVQQVRSAQFSLEPLVTRLVVDLAGTSKYRTSTDKNGRVLIIETSPLKPGEAIKDKLIYIDPGHGGSDPGAGSYSGQIAEKDITLDIALRLAAILRENGARVEMSRTRDKTVDLNQRPYNANEINADVFISIHANSFTTATPRGTETHFYAPSSRQHLYDQRAERKRLAESIHQFMVEDLGIPDRGVKESNFAVLRESKMPSVLVETAFISHPEEEALLADPQFRQKVAEAIAKGINSYFME